MFKKVASDMLGLSEVGTVIAPADYDKVDSDDYVMHEDGEKIYFLIKSRTDEYCFTNKALIHLDGTSAVSKKRTLRRYSYWENTISNVSLETAGTVDLDVEIKFVLGQTVFSIDVHKKHLEELKDLYKALLKIAEINHENEAFMQYAQQSLNLASATMSRVQAREDQLVESFNGLNESAFNWLADKRSTYVVKDFGHVYEKFINN
ncbi:PH domain-containing protein [Fictibacillus iocasae]|uniref:PH domain-containing protein n=1 Tax=Fictibacillus iocasae TaxID=2715437 RepID=A0ABW2NVD0_9BACL